MIRGKNNFYCLNLNVPGEFKLENLIFGITSCDKLITRLCYCKNSYRAKYSELSKVSDLKLRHPLYKQIRVLETVFGPKDLWTKIEKQSKFVSFNVEIYPTISERVLISLAFEAQAKGVIPYTLNKQQGDPLSADLEEKILERRKEFRNLTNVDGFEKMYHHLMEFVQNQSGTIIKSPTEFLNGMKEVEPVLSSSFNHKSIKEVDEMNNKEATKELENLGSKSGVIISVLKNHYVVVTGDLKQRKPEINNHVLKLGDFYTFQKLRGNPKRPSKEAIQKAISYMKKAAGKTAVKSTKLQPAPIQKNDALKTLMVMRRAKELVLQLQEDQEIEILALEEAKRMLSI